MQKRPPSHQKMKCSFLDYVQLLLFSLDLLLSQSGSSVIIIIVLVTLILSGGAVAMYHWV